MRIPNKFNGYSADNRRLYNMGGGGGGPNTTYSQTSNIPEYARPYVEQMLGATQRQLFTGSNDSQGNFKPTGFNNFTPYGYTAQKDDQGNDIRDASGNVMFTNTARQQAQAAVAPVSAGQQMATNTINQYVAPQQTAAASQMTADLTGRSAAAGYYSPLQAERFQLGAPQQVRTDSFTQPGVSQGYMSPYMQNVVNAQQREARRAGEIQRNQNQAQAVNAGAFGGSRQAIMEAERQRNLGTQLGDIQAQGLQSAYQQGMGQFNAEQQAYLAAQQANQQANMQTGIQNLQAQQQAQAAQEASRQFGANLGLQGYGQAMQGAAQLGQLGQQQYGQDMGTIQAMAGLGAQEQAQEQNIINQQMQNYGTAQQYPLMQLGVMSNMLRGLPMQSSTTNMYQAQPSTMSQLAGAAGTGLGLVQQYQKAFPGSKEGGVVKMAAGGIATGVPASKLSAELEGPRFTDEILQKKAGDPQTDQATKDLVAAEQARRAGLRAGMANGGIIAFKKGEGVEDKERIEAEKNKPVESEMYAVPERKTSSRPITDKTLYNPDQGADETTRDYYRQKGKQLDEIKSEGNRIIAKRDLRDMNAGIAAAASKVSPVPDASRTTPPPSPSPADAGITAAPNKMLGNVNQLYSDVEAANLEAGLNAAGQRSTPLDPTQQALLGLTQDIEKEKAEAKVKMDQSSPDLVKSYQKAREDMGLADPANREREMFEARKTRGEKSEQETARNNLIRFLTKWGTIPGSTMRGLIGAGSDLIDKMDVDEKHRQKFLNEMDDIESKINSSEYARRLGDEDRARKEKDEAGKLYYKLAHDLNKTRLDIALKDKDLQRAIETQMYKNEAILAKQANTPAIIQEINIKAAELMQTNAEAIRSGKKTKEQIAAEAMDYVLARQPSVTSTAMTLPSREASAGADVTRATTGVGEAATKAKKDARDAVIALDKAVRAKTMTDETISRDIDAANRKDKTGKAAKEIIDRVRKELAPEYGVPLSAPAPAAPAAPAAPKKDAAPAAKPDISKVDGAPAGSTVGKAVAGKGWEVKDKSGKLIGYVQQ